MITISGLLGAVGIFMIIPTKRSTKATFITGLVLIIIGFLTAGL